MDNQFSASASALGYLFQLRFALRIALERYQRGLDWSVSIETTDDVEASSTEGGQVAYSLKHHTTPVNLTNASPDFWKSIRVWAEGVKAGRIDLLNVDLVLVTTSSVPAGGAPALLQSGPERDVAGALVKMTQTAANSKSDVNSLAYASFNRLAPRERKALVQAIVVVGASPDIEAIEGQIRGACSLIFGHTHLDAALERVEGWWFRTCLEQLTGHRESIDGPMLEERLRDLRTQFGPDGLPIDDDILDLQIEDDHDLESRFVHQLRLIELTSPRVATAIRDYRRAFAQRSRWTRDGNLIPGELDRYEERLSDEWRRCYDEMVEDLGEEAAEAAKVTRARQLYRWSQDVELQIRPKCDEPFVRRGTFHILADAMAVGWHPEFEMRLLQLLESESTPS